METETFEISLNDEEFQLLRSAVSSKWWDWHRAAEEEPDYQRNHYFNQMKNHYSDLQVRLSLLHMDRVRERRDRAAE